VKNLTQDLAVYLAVLAIFYLIFRVYLKIDKQQKEITKIIRQLALEEKEDLPRRGSGQERPKINN
jgi:hypothetical protein